MQTLKRQKVIKAEVEKIKTVTPPEAVVDKERDDIAR